MTGKRSCPESTFHIRLMLHLHKPFPSSRMILAVFVCTQVRSLRPWAGPERSSLLFTEGMRWGSTDGASSIRASMAAWEEEAAGIYLFHWIVWLNTSQYFMLILINYDYYCLQQRRSFSTGATRSVLRRLLRRWSISSKRRRDIM